MDTIGTIVPPTKDLTGKPLDPNVVFFKMPQDIGTLLCGDSNFYKDSPTKEKSAKSSFWNKLINFFTPAYNYHNYLVGTDGFAIYSCRNNTDNLKKVIEVKFNDTTDFFLMHKHYSKNFVYQYSEVLTTFYNRKTNKINWDQTETYHRKHTNKSHIFNLVNCVEFAWTEYLMRSLSNDIEKYLFENGNLIFIIYNDRTKKLEEFVKLEVGKITFLQGKNAPFTYHFNEIKKAYVKGGELFIEHTNYQKNFIFFSSGNKNAIPLGQLFNQKFFFRALSKLLGNIFSEE